jgi:O-antigen ligase
MTAIGETLRTDGNAGIFVHGASAVSTAKWWARDEESPSLHGEGESTIAFVAVVVFTLLLLLSPQTWFPILGKLRVAFLAAGAAGAFLLWDRWKQRESLLDLTPEMLVGFGLPVWAVMTVPLSYWPGGSVAMLSETYLKALAIFWLLANLVTTRSRLRVVAFTLIVCSLPLAVTGLNNYYTGNFLTTSEMAVVRIVGYQTGLAANPNDLALMLNLILPLAIASFLGATRPSIRIFCLLAIGLNVLCVIMTFSRGGFLGLATIAVVYTVRLIRRPGSDRAWAFAAIFVAVLSLPLLPSEYVKRLSTITNMDSDTTGSSQERWAITMAAIRSVKARPINGAGLGMDVLALNDMGGPQWKMVHNVYLQYAVDLGVPGLVLFLMLLLGVFKAVRMAQRSVAGLPKHRSIFLLAEGVEISLIVFATEGFFHPVAYNFYFYYIGGLALATRVVTNNTLRTAAA